MAISDRSIGHHHGQVVSNSGGEKRSPSLSQPPLDEKVDEAGWGCTSKFLFSVHVQEHAWRTVTLWGTAHLLPHPDSELLSSALSIVCTGDHWDNLTKASPIISLHLLYFTHFPYFISWVKMEKAGTIFSCLFNFIFFQFIFCISFISFFPASGYFLVWFQLSYFLLNQERTAFLWIKVWNRSWWKWEKLACFHMLIF